MYSYHILLLPIAVVAVVALHILLVRRHGIVPPIPLADSAAAPAPEQ
jgi:ubiquinol-cytochrome c reductase cytochrome b subunit